MECAVSDSIYSIDRHGMVVGHLKRLDDGGCGFEYINVFTNYHYLSLLRSYSVSYSGDYGNRLEWLTMLWLVKDLLNQKSVHRILLVVALTFEIELGGGSVFVQHVISSIAGIG